MLCLLDTRTSGDLGSVFAVVVCELYFRIRTKNGSLINVYTILQRIVGDLITVTKSCGYKVHFEERERNYKGERNCFFRAAALNFRLKTFGFFPIQGSIKTLVNPSHTCTRVSVIIIHLHGEMEV